MKYYLLSITTLLLILFLVFYLTPTLFSAKSDFGVLGAMVVLFFITPSVVVFSFNKIKKWRSK